VIGTRTPFRNAISSAFCGDLATIPGRGMAAKYVFEVACTRYMHYCYRADTRAVGVAPIY